MKSKCYYCGKEAKTQAHFGTDGIGVWPACCGRPDCLSELHQIPRCACSDEIIVEARGNVARSRKRSVWSDPSLWQQLGEWALSYAQALTPKSEPEEENICGAEFCETDPAAAYELALEIRLYGPGEKRVMPDGTVKDRVDRLLNMILGDGPNRPPESPTSAEPPSSTNESTH